MEKKLLTPQDLAERWNLATNTLSQWRWNGRSPRFLKIGGRVLYRLKDIEAFEQKMLRQNTSKENFQQPVPKNNLMKEKSLNSK